jgi:ABC-type glutathione transport system ATPase component
VKPKLLICDEIVSSLDDFNKLSVLKVIRELVENQGIAILFINHDMKVVKKICDKIYAMNPL